MWPSRITPTISSNAGVFASSTYSSEQTDRLSVAAVIYLLLPFAVFAASWFATLLSIVATACVIVAAVPIFAAKSDREQPRLISIAYCVLLAGIAVTFSGASPLVASIPELDLAKHRWLYNDLVRSSWPVALRHDEFSLTILRYTFGLYAAPALLASFIGGQIDQVILLGWTALGVALFLMIVARQAQSTLGALLFPIVALTFSGLDVFGVLLAETHRLDVFGFREDWSHHFHGWAIFSNLFGLSWTPQHNVSAWLACAVLYDHHRRRWFQRTCGLILVATAFWSVFVAATFAMATALCFLTHPHWPQSLRSTLRTWWVIPSLLLALLLAFYLGQDTSSIPMRFTFGTQATFAYVGRYIVFLGLEFGLLALVVVLALRRVPAELFVATVVIMLMPLVFVGGSNDLMMRGSTVPMTLLLFCTLRALSAATWRMRTPIIVVLVLGATTSLGEVGRLLRAPPTPGDWSHSIVTMKPPFDRQYIARIPRDSTMARLLGL